MVALNFIFVIKKPVWLSPPYSYLLCPHTDAMQDHFTPLAFGAQAVFTFPFYCDYGWLQILTLPCSKAQKKGDTAFKRYIYQKKTYTGKFNKTLKTLFWQHGPLKWPMPNKQIPARVSCFTNTCSRSR